MSTTHACTARLGIAALVLALAPLPALAQGAPRQGPGPDSVTIVAGERYRAGGLHRFLLGSGYRNLWTTSMQVEVLDLHTFAGGLTPRKIGGGKETVSLQFVTPDGVEYKFRLMLKRDAVAPGLKGTVVDAVFRDQMSTNDPGAPLVAARLLDAAGVLHVTPLFAVMPDDPLLGQFRAQFAGTLGLLEESPGTPRHHAGFAGAAAIIASDSLLTLLNSDPAERIDARALLAARLMDMLFNDWDRHPGQWNWARMPSSQRASWLPIPNDRDKTFITSGGIIPRLASMARPTIYHFTGVYPSVQGLTWNSLEFDRRLLGGLEKPVWDSVVAALTARITDAVIDDAVLAAPAEYLPSAPQLAATLKLRRDALPGAADRFYRLIAAVADIHATDAADRATVTRIDDRLVEVRLQSESGTPYFRRRFDASETSEIRIYLHGGDDTAIVTGSVGRSIPVRIIGGSGTNQLLDSSRVGGSRRPTHLYDVGTVERVGYGPDTLFNREPWVMERGKLVSPGRDRGAQFGPVGGLGHDRDLGYLPRFGVYSTVYGYGRRPYASRVGLEAAYGTSIGGFRIGLTADQRYEGTDVHLMVSARMSQFEIARWHGLGNDTPDSSMISTYFDARQRQWMVRPAIGLAFGPRSDVSIGPIVQYSVTDSTVNRFLTDDHPYGFGRFGQAGLQLVLHEDARDRPQDPHSGLTLDLTASWFPAVWDVKSPFEVISYRASTYLTFPIPVHPILVLTGGAKKVFGTFPFHEAATLGGFGTLRSMDGQRYAGDAAMYGSMELRIPVARFALVLPWNVGVFGVVDAGRVYVNGASPGGWHTSRGVGVWIGVLDPNNLIRACVRPGEGGPC